MLSSLASTCLTLLFPALTLSNGLQRSHFKKEEEKRFKWKRNHFGTLVGFTESLSVHAFSRSVLALGKKTKQNLIEIEEKPDTRQMFTQSCVTVSKRRN